MSEANLPERQLVKDVGSGINFKRPGLQTILESAIEGTLGEVVVAYKDRLCRFGFELIEFIINKSGGTLTILSQENEEPKSSNEELADDLLSIITVFNARQIGKRRYQKRQNTLSCTQGTDENEIETVDGNESLCV